MTKMSQSNFRFPYPRRFGFDWPSSFGEEDVWALYTTDGRTGPLVLYTISSPMSLSLRFAKNPKKMQAYILLQLLSSLAYVGPD